MADFFLYFEQLIKYDYSCLAPVKNKKSGDEDKGGLTMDITKINQAGHPRPSAFDGITNDKGFKQIFDRKLSGVNSIASPTSADPKTDLLYHSDKMLDLLDDYAKELGSPLKTLKDIEPIVSSIEKEVDLIESKTSGIVLRDGEIERFVKDLSVTALVAVLKFQRGDYL